MRHTKLESWNRHDFLKETLCTSWTLRHIRLTTKQPFTLRINFMFPFYKIQSKSILRFHRLLTLRAISQTVWCNNRALQHWILISNIGYNLSLQLITERQENLYAEFKIRNKAIWYFKKLIWNWVSIWSGPLRNAEDKKLKIFLTIVAVMHLQSCGVILN